MTLKQKIFDYLLDYEAEEITIQECRDEILRVIELEFKKWVKKHEKQTKRKI